MVLVLLGLGACMHSGKSPVVRSIQPQQADVPKVTDVRVEQLLGPALPMAKLLSNAVTASLNEYGVKSSTRHGEASRYVLEGRAEANWNDHRVPFVMLIYWTLSDQDGDRVGEYIQGVRGARWQWEYGDPLIIRSVGNGAAKPLAAMIIDEQDNVLPVLLMGAGILVEPISGAPGDGNQSLRRAIIAALGRADVSVTDDRRQASLKLMGSVNMARLDDGRDKVEIVWRMMRVDDFEIGRATQENILPAGTLNGAWGEEAEAIAIAAVDGIERILASGHKRPGPSITNPGGTPPASPDLKSIPGRAPPPPE